MTKAEEANMWARLVALEKAVVKLKVARDVPDQQPVEPKEGPLHPEPPRDRHLPGGPFDPL